MNRTGIFDSGAGGISVLHMARRILPAPEYLYYADTARAPYGTRSVEEVRAFSDEIVSFLLKEGAGSILIACNTATSAAVGMLREKFDIPIVGMEPAVKPALKKVSGDAADKGTEEKRVLVLATPLTVRENKLHDLVERLDGHNLVDLLAVPGLVELAESERFDGTEVEELLDNTFGKTDTASYGAVVTGCTHFNYFLPALRRRFPEDCVFTDGNEGTVRRLAQLTDGKIIAEDNLSKAHSGSSGDVGIRWYESGIPVTGGERLERFKRFLARMDEIY